MCDTNRMQMRSDTWVVIPAFNEAPVIGGVIAGVRALFPRVLVVDDASGDDTAALARSAGAYTAVHPLNLGQGAALQTGFDAALARGARYVVTFDADGQHDPADAAVAVTRVRADDENVEGAAVKRIRGRLSVPVDLIVADVHDSVGEIGTDFGVEEARR